MTRRKIPGENKKSNFAFLEHVAFFKGQRLEKNLFQCCFAKIKNSFDSFTNRDRMNHFTDWAQGHGVMHDILYFDITGDFFEQMLMVPKPKGTQSLFIEKIGRCLDMGDFRNPACRHEGHRFNAIGDNHSLMHVSWVVGSNL